MKKNILYLLNHKTLSDFDLPILQNKNWGIYLPKKYQSLDITQSINLNNLSLYDKYLNDISDDDKLFLDNIDFFNSSNYSIKLMDILNKNFKIIFLTLLTDSTVHNFMVNNFKGKIYYRLFGRESNYNYYSCFNNKSITQNNPNFIFSYQEIIDFEFKLSNFFINKSYYVPLGLPNFIFSKYENTYNPIINKCVFVCSKINICSYYTAIYNNLNQQLSEFEFTILGKNNEKINDPRIKNNLNDDEYYLTMSQHYAMYYHGIEPRHLHYHPLEAIVIGIPIIFHQESLLTTSYLCDSPGKCISYLEVKEKLNKLKNNDIIFKNSIISYQNNIKNKLKIENNLNIYDFL